MVVKEKDGDGGENKGMLIEGKGEEYWRRKKENDINENGKGGEGRR